MENNKKVDHADDNLQIRISVKPRFKAGAELPTAVNLELDMSEENRLSLAVHIS